MDIAQDRLVRKETSLGTLREAEPPQDHIGLRLIAPFEGVEDDEVIFDYMKPLTSGLAPARAEDAESELAQKDEIFGGTGRASIIDWAIKDHYTASDVTRYTQANILRARLGVGGLDDLPLVKRSMGEDFRDTVSRDEARRKDKLDNRIEWLIMTALETGGITYSDNRISFNVNFGRPSDQNNQDPTGAYWDLTTSDPIGDIKRVQRFMYDRYGITIDRAITSNLVLDQAANSDRFIARAAGLVLPGYGVPSGGTNVQTPTPIDLNYTTDGWGPQAALQVIQRQTGVTFIPYDAVYRTRPLNSTTVTNNRFTSENKIIFLPSEDDVRRLGLDDRIGFAKTLTSPHPEGDWESGWYEWEIQTRDPWGLDRGTGIKAFPIFPRMEFTYTMIPMDPTP